MSGPWHNTSCAGVSATSLRLVLGEVEWELQTGAGGSRNCVAPHGNRPQLGNTQRRCTWMFRRGSCPVECCFACDAVNESIRGAAANSSVVPRRGGSFRCCAARVIAAVSHRADTVVRWRRLRLQPTRMISPLARSGLSGRNDGMRVLVWRAGRICEACAQQQDTEYREPECVDNEPTTLFRTSGGCQVACLDCGVVWRW